MTTKDIKEMLKDARSGEIGSHPDLNTITAYDIGRWVEYHGSAGEVEKGRIKSWNKAFVFVVYKCNNEWDRYMHFTGVATLPKELVFLE